MRKLAQCLASPQGFEQGRKVSSKAFSTLFQQDAALRQKLLLRLGEHYEFQAAQRVAASNIFAASETTDDLLAVSWDKMDQAKTIVPRIAALANTHFQKGGTRLVVSLIGVSVPSILSHPFVYTILEDQVQGSDMIASLMVDVLEESSKVRGCLPRRLFIKADNTAKETKNTILIFAAVWLLIQLKGTRLEVIEFGYLIVGHTHDSLDAFFAYINKAVHGQDVLSLPDFFDALRRRMRQPPPWKHLRDVYGFRERQPSYLSPKNIVGIGAPHNVRLSWGRDGSIFLEHKKFLTSSKWSAPVCICDTDQVRELQRLWPEAHEPAWDPSFAQSALNWLQKLRGLLENAGRSSAGLAHCEDIVRHKLKEFLPSGRTLQQRVQAMRGISKAIDTNDGCISPDLESACTAAFPGSSGGTFGKETPNRCRALRALP